MYENIGARIPKNIRQDIEYVAKEKQTDKSRVIRGLLQEAVKAQIVQIAIEKYAQGQISIGKASEIARVPIADFMVLLANQKVPLNYTVDMLKEDIAAAKKAEKRA